jgi:hypothetical protein
VRRKIDRYELSRKLGPDRHFASINAAVDAFREQTGADWTSSAPKSR